jgi:raffinose/stachyose/melibiose transport system permease protein
MKMRARRLDFGYAPFLVPGVVLFAVVVLGPFVANVVLSFTRWRGVGTPSWLGLENYRRLLQDEAFWASFRNNVALIVAMTVIPTIIGLLLASLLFDYVAKRFARSWATRLRAAYYLPQVLPVAVAGVVWGWILHPSYGVLNTFLERIGLESLTRSWLGDPDTALPAVMAVMVWIQIGYPVVMFMAGLQRVDPEMYEAAELDGANWFQRFRYISIAAIRPEIYVVVLTTTIAALKVFGPIFVLTRGGPGTAALVPSYFSYQNFFERADVGYGSAISTVLAAIIIVVAAVFIRFQNRRELATLR